MLWNTSCSGNKTYAMNEFFINKSQLLYTNNCFLGSEHCSNMTSSERSSRYGRVKDWMRSPQCYSDYAEWSSLRSISGPNNMPLIVVGDGPISEEPDVCCSGCIVGAGNVDVYYWPEANASTSCLDIVGNTIHPLDYGATTDADGIYWGCTGQDSSLTKTAHLEIVNTNTHKIFEKSPWSSDPCSGPPLSKSKPTTSTRTDNLRPEVLARAHALITKSSIQNLTLPIVTAVVGNFTL